MKAKRILSLAAALSLLGGTALADGAMSAEEMQAIWQASFDKMNTTSEPRFFHNLTDMSDVTIDPSCELIYRLPGENDLSYEDALSIARQAIFDKYATPPEELDAMGLYPDFIAAEAGCPAEWRFYFTPLQNANIDEDHSFPAPGEYRVYLDSPSGEVTLCNWYIDDFWPYAQRVWGAGKQDIVYAYAQKSGFLALPADEQSLWLKRLEAVGYDMAGVISGESLFKDGYFLLELRGEGLEALPDDDPRASAAWQALADDRGLDTALMRKYRYIAVASPIEGNETDVFIVYDISDERAMRHGGDADFWCAQLLGEADRLGLFLVRFDPATGEVRCVTHGDRPTLPRDEGEPGTLLGRTQWSAEDLPLFDEAYQRLEAAVTEAVQNGLRRDEQQPIANGIMRELGGQEEVYPLEAESPNIGLEAAFPIARHAAAEAAGLTDDEFAARFTTDEAAYNPTMNYYAFWFFAPVEVDEIMYLVQIDAATGDIIYAAQSHGNG